MALPDGHHELLLTGGLPRSLAGMAADSADVLALQSITADLPAIVIRQQLASPLHDVAGAYTEAAKRQLQAVHGLRVLQRQGWPAADDLPAGCAEGIALTLPAELGRSMRRAATLGAKGLAP